MATLAALTIIVPGIGAIPVVQLDVALVPGVIVTVHVALGANVPVHVVGTVVISVAPWLKQQALWQELFRCL